MFTPTYTANLTEQQRARLEAEYQQASKSEIVAVLLSFFLGGFGIHKFYMRQTRAGILYLIFFWTGIPAIIALIECFLMPGRVREYNAAQAKRITDEMLASRPRPSASVAESDAGLDDAARICSACRATAQVGAVFCARCGAGTFAAG